MKMNKKILVNITFLGIILAVALTFTRSFADTTENPLLIENYSTWITKQHTKLSVQDAVVIQNTKNNLKTGQSLTYQVNAPSDALYRLSLNYLSTQNSLINPEFSIKVNGVNEYYESQNIIAPTLWKNKNLTFQKNQSGDDLIPEQVVAEENNLIILNDASYSQQNGLLFYFHKGQNNVELTMTSGQMQINQLNVISGSESLPSYQKYSANLPKSNIKNQISFEAELTSLKNNSYAQPKEIKSADVTPYNPKNLLFNVFGGSSWEQSGQSVTWKFDVQKTGSYTLTVKNEQNNSGKAVFRTIAIDGSVPFSELEAYRFDTNSSWTNTTLGNNKTDFKFYFTKGEHTLTMTATDAPVAKEVTELGIIMNQINDLGLQVQKLTGNNINPNYQWNIKQYIPDVDIKFGTWLDELNSIQKEIKNIYGSDNSKAQEIVQLTLVINQLKKIAKEPNKLPQNLQDLSQGSAGVTQTIATIEQDLQLQPLTIDKFYLSANEKLPSAKANLLTSLSSSVSEFFYSFMKNDSTHKDSKTITVWVERSQQYVDLMQSMADSDFTAKTGIKVDFQIIPDESKLLLSSATGEEPDAALGISVGTPYNLALRGAVEPLNNMPGFKDLAKQFSPGAFIPTMVNQNIYAMPETQDFYVQFTRNDILNKLGISAPDNWNQVLSDLPELQRYGMNYYIPLSGSAGTKAMMFTAPFIFQFGGHLYSPNGEQTAINSTNSINGLKFMTDLYNTYSLPLQVNSFYNSFRYGQIPIGISNFQTYVQLVSAAPEIANEWSIQPYPGVVQSDGSVNREAPGSAQEDMIFKGTSKTEQAWRFLKWWESSQTQTQFATELQTTYGPAYMWNTANLTAFAQLPWPVADKTAILNEWQQLEEAPQTPAGYMEERQISNVWTDVVFNGQNVRSAVENNSMIINKEITSRLADFGYIKNNKLIKNYTIPTVNTVKEIIGEK